MGDEREGVDKKKGTKNNKRSWAFSQKKGCPSHKFFYVPFSITQFVLLGFP